MPVLFCAVLERATALKSPRLFDGFDKVASAPDYADEYERVVRAIAGHLAQRPEMAPAGAEAVTRESLAWFLDNHGAPPRKSGLCRLRHKAAKFVRSGLRFAGVPDVHAARTLNDYLDGLEGDARGQFRTLLAAIERGYRTGW